MLAERGAKVVLGARGLNRLEALACRTEATGGEVTYPQTDVRRREELTSLVSLALYRYGPARRSHQQRRHHAGVAPG